MTVARRCAICSSTWRLSSRFSLWISTTPADFQLKFEWSETLGPGVVAVAGRQKENRMTEGILAYAFISKYCDDQIENNLNLETESFS